MRNLLYFVLIGTCINASGQGLQDFFKELGKAVNEKIDQNVRENAENPCLDKEVTAQVDRIDTARAGSWVVETTDGRMFQLSSMAFAGTVEGGMTMADYLSTAQTVTFTLIGGDRFTKTYRVHIEYAAPASGSGGLGGILASAVTATVQKRLPNDLTLVNGGIQGTALSGGDWCLNVPTSTLRTIRVIGDSR